MRAAMAMTGKTVSVESRWVSPRKWFVSTPIFDVIGIIATRRSSVVIR